jgi:hypothetical protein
MKILHLLILLLLLFIFIYIITKKKTITTINTIRLPINNTTQSPSTTQTHTIPITYSNISNEHIKNTNNILTTNGWEYNEWILPIENKKDTCFSLQYKNTATWDNKGINIKKVEKIPKIIPIELPNIGDTAVVKNENDWLFNPSFGTINLTK